MTEGCLSGHEEVNVRFIWDYTLDVVTKGKVTMCDVFLKSKRPDMEDDVIASHSRRFCLQLSLKLLQSEKDKIMIK